MDRFRELQTFVAVADSGGFAKAAAYLRSSPPAVTRIVASLERRLGARLFTRTTRSVRLTEAGLIFADRARRLLAALAGAEMEITGESGIPTGLLTITGPLVMGRVLLPEIVAGFLGTHPRVGARVVLLDRTANLVEEGIDVALRIGQLPDSSLIAHQIGEVRQVLVASPRYLAKRGMPTTPAELRRHDLIVFTGLRPSRAWNLGKDKAPGRVALEPRFEINDAAAAIAATQAGHGIALLVSYMVAAQIGQGRLVPVLDDVAPPPVPVQLVYPESKLVAPKLRAFLDYATPRLRARLRDLALPARTTARRLTRRRQPESLPPP